MEFLGKRAGLPYFCKQFTPLNTFRTLVRRIFKYSLNSDLGKQSFLVLAFFNNFVFKIPCLLKMMPISWEPIQTQQKATQKIFELFTLEQKRYTSKFSLHSDLGRRVFFYIGICLITLYLKYRISSYSFCSWIVSAHLCTVTLALCTVTFGFQIQKRIVFTEHIWWNTVLSLLKTMPISWEKGKRPRKNIFSVYPCSQNSSTEGMLNSRTQKQAYLKRIPILSIQQ